MVFHWFLQRRFQWDPSVLVAYFRMTMVMLPADQFTMRAYTSREPEDPEYTVDSLLPFLGLGQTECDLNHYVLPMQTSVQTYVCPALESAEARWVPWDTTLADNFRLHMLVCDRELFLSMRHFASNRNYLINLGEQIAFSPMWKFTACHQLKRSKCLAECIALFADCAMMSRYFKPRCACCAVHSARPLRILRPITRNWPH